MLQGGGGFLSFGDDDDGPASAGQGLADGLRGGAGEVDDGFEAVVGEESALGWEVPASGEDGGDRR